MAKRAETETENEALPVPKFTKQQILKSNRYQNRRDLLSVLLKDEQQYSHDEIDTIVDAFMTKGQVK